MDRDRNAVKPAVILKLEDRQYVYEETIQPEASTMTTASPSSSPQTTKPK